MTAPKDAPKKSSPFFKRLTGLLWQERHILFWSAIAAGLLSVLAIIFIRRKFITFVITILTSWAHGCKSNMDGLKELH